MLGAAPLFDVDEGAFSQATLEMFQRGDFLSTTLNGQPRYDKPILVYWLQAVFVYLLGPSEWAFRLPSAICGALWAFMTYAFAKRIVNEEKAMLAAVVLSTSVGVFIIGRAATADALLNLLIAASMFAAWLHLSTGKRGWLYLAHAAIALGLLAKGPIAVLVPFAVTLLFCLFKRDIKTWARAVFDWRALLLLLAIAAPWYAIILAKEGWGFVDGFFLRHNVGRFGGPMQGHGGSLLYYFPALLALTLPFTALLVPVALRLREIWRDELQAYLLLWFVFVFVFFSLSGTKLPHYLLYGLTGLVVLMAVHAGAVRLAFWALLPALLVLLLFVPYVWEQAAAGIGHPDLLEIVSAARANLNPAHYYTLGFFAVLIVFGMIERRFSTAAKIAAAGVLVSLALSTLMVPLAGKLVQAPIREAALYCKSRNLEPIMWRLNAPSFSVYRGSPTASREPRAGDVVITRTRRLAELPGGMRYELLYDKLGIALVRILP